MSDEFMPNIDSLCEKIIAQRDRIEALENALRERDELIRLMRRSGSRKPNPQPNLRGSAAASRPVEAAPVAGGIFESLTASAERGRYYDIIIEAAGWSMTAGCWTTITKQCQVLHRIMKRMRKRLEM